MGSISLDEAKALWEPGRWPDFVAEEMSCRCCGEVYWSPQDFDAIQRLRSSLSRPVRLNSAHRCRRHNARVGGAPKSEHKKIAFDFSLASCTAAEKATLRGKMVEAGFSTFGLYGTFIHMDRRPGRFWATAAGEQHKEWFK